MVICSTWYRFAIGLSVCNRIFTSINTELSAKCSNFRLSTTILCEHRKKLIWFGYDFSRDCLQPKLVNKGVDVEKRKFGHKENNCSKFPFFASLVTESLGI